MAGALYASEQEGQLPPVCACFFPPRLWCNANVCQSSAAYICAHIHTHTVTHTACCVLSTGANMAVQVIKGTDKRQVRHYNSILLGRKPHQVRFPN